MRSICLVALAIALGVTAGCKTDPPPTPARNRAAERSYANATATAFFKTLRADGNREQLALTTRAFQERHKDTGGVCGGWANYSFGLLGGNEQDSPDGSEWLLTGPVHSQAGNDFIGQWDARVVKDGEGKWRVDYFDARVQVKK